MTELLFYLHNKSYAMMLFLPFLQKRELPLCHCEECERSAAGRSNPYFTIIKRVLLMIHETVFYIYAWFVFMLFFWIAAPQAARNDRVGRGITQKQY
jgi:hypothetical protein